jgi:hypothetical protein
MLVLVWWRSVLNLAAFERDKAGGSSPEAGDHDDRELDPVVPTVEEGDLIHLARSAVGSDSEDPSAGRDVFAVTKDDVLEAGACGDVDA